MLDIYDADSASFLIGGSGRVHILPWLGAEASIDLAFGGDFENNDVSVFLVPFEFAALFYPPVEWPVRPYGTAGIGFTIIDVHYSGALSGVSDHTDLRPLFFIGFGAEFDLTPGIMLDANFRFVFVNNPSRFQGNSADWFQFTVGILFKLSQ